MPGHSLLHIARVALAACAVLPAPGAGLSVDTTHREEARVFFNSVYSFSENAPIAFTGDVTAGVAGTTGTAFREAVRVRVNWFRAMAGVPADVAFSDTLHAKCQQAALMMSANDQLSHTPPANWLFYTAAGAEAAGQSNLFLGANGPGSITGYIEDPGEENAELGHRRWIFYPQTQTMGTGDVPAQNGKREANALWIFDAHFGGPRPAVRDEFVAWPPPGYVPYQVVFPRWSFSYPGADFSNATVTLTRNGQPLGKTIEPISSGFGENTIAWIPADRDLDVPVTAAPAQDTVTAVTVGGVKIGAQTRSFSYSVRVFDPAETGADTELATISGPGMATFGLPNDYTCAAVPRATGYDWETGTPVPLDAVEGAEEGLDHVLADISGSYEVISSVHKSGAKGFHFANPDFRRQSLELDRVIVPSAASQIRWQSRLGWATAAQTARVQVSVDEGLTWKSIYSQTGTDSAGEGSFVERSVSLASYAGRAVRIRFLFDYRSGGAVFLSVDDGVGWHLDDIRVTVAEEITARALASENGGAALQFTPPDPAVLSLRVRPVFFGKYRGEWAPVKPVDATALPASLTVNISPAGGGTVAGATAGTSPRIVGEAITLTAKPAPGFLFREWTGDLTSTERTLGFTMPEILVLNANFIPSPWPGGRGKYVGLIHATPASSAGAGLITVTLDSAGAFSGSVVIGGKKRGFTGRFDASGVGSFGRVQLAEFTLPGVTPAVRIALALDTSESPLTHISATVTEEGMPPLTAIATRSLLTGAESPQPPLLNAPATWIGGYTARITAAVPAGAGPRGDGWARMSVSKNGSVLLTGILADGTPVTAAGKFRDDGVWAIYRPLYQRAGALTGEIALQDLAASDVAGSLRWFRPAAVSGRFADGWAAGLVTDFSGSRYRRPATGARVLSALDAAAGAATVTCEFAAAVVWPVNVGLNGRITLDPAAVDPSLRGSVNPLDGTWTGAFSDPASASRVNYRGVVLQKEGIFAGYFLTPTDGGRIRLAP